MVRSSYLWSNLSFLFSGPILWLSSLRSFQTIIRFHGSLIIIFIPRPLDYFSRSIASSSQRRNQATFFWNWCSFMGFMKKVVISFEPLLSYEGLRWNDAWYELNGNNMIAATRKDQPNKRFLLARNSMAIGWSRRRWKEELTNKHFSFVTRNIIPFLCLYLILTGIIKKNMSEDMWITGMRFQGFFKASIITIFVKPSLSFKRSFPSHG